MADDDKKKPAPQKPIEKRKEKKPSVDPTIGNIDKGVQGANKNLDALIQRSGQVSNRAEQRADLLLQAADAQKKIDELSESGRAEDAAEMQKALDETSKLLKGSKTDAAIGNRLAELATINSDTASLIEKYGSKEEQENKENLSGINGIITKLDDQKKVFEDDTKNVGTLKQLKKLEGAFGQFSTKETEALREAYDSASADLESALENGDDRAAELAQAQLDEIAKGAESEESRREAKKINLEANSRLMKIGNAMEEFGQKFDDVAMAGAKGAGFLAGLTGLALLFIDPDTFNAIMTDIIDKAGIVFDTLYAMVSGDFDKASELFNENMGLFGKLIGGIMLLFTGKIIKIIGTALKVARGFRIFMMGTFIPTLIGMFSAITTAMAPIVAAMAPILLPVLAIMALIGGLYFGFKKLQESLGPGASIMDTLKVGMLYFVDFLSMIVNGITFIPRKIIGMLGPRLAKWIMGDDFDTSVIDNLAAGLDTGRGKRAAAEMKAKNEAAALEAANAEPEPEFDMANMTEEELMAQVNAKTTIPGDDILSQSDANAAAQKEAQVGGVNAVITNATGGNVQNNNVVRSTVVQSPITKATSTLASVTSR